MADFASFVKDAREKKKNELLAQEFLGRGRKAQASGAGSAKSQRETSEKPTLLSRISGAGVQKQRSSSAKPATAAAAASANIDGKWQHDLHKLNNPNGPPGKRASRVTTAQIDRNSKTYDKFASVLNRNANVHTNDAPGFSIRGVANGGPYTVIASNFAPGTTAADIEAVMTPVGGETLGCRLISAAPTVMVELQFVDKQGAENVIATFNNQKVRLLLRKTESLDTKLTYSPGRRQTPLRLHERSPRKHAPCPLPPPARPPHPIIRRHGRGYDSQRELSGRTFWLQRRRPKRPTPWTSQAVLNVFVWTEDHLLFPPNNTYAYVRYPILQERRRYKQCRIIKL